MVAFNNMSVTFGQLVASSIGAGFAQVEGEGWRATVGIGAAPPLILAGLLFLCPESPRQLVSHGKLEAADAVLLRIYPTSTDEQRQAKITSIELSLQDSATMSDESILATLKKVFTTPSTGRAVLTACVVMAISQLGGFNTLMYYAATLFSIVGFKNSTAVGITVSGTNFVFSIVNLVLVDRFGRRKILMVTVLGMSICMIVTLVAFLHIPVNLDTLEVESSSVGWPADLVLVVCISFSHTIHSFTCLTYYRSLLYFTWPFFHPALQPLDGSVLSLSHWRFELWELCWFVLLLPVICSPNAYALIIQNTVTCWGCNIIIASTYLSMMKTWTPSGTFGFYAAICFLGWVFVAFFFPECKGMPLEAIREVFSKGFGVGYSKKWQKDHKHDAKVETMVIGH